MWENHQLIFIARRIKNATGGKSRQRGVQRSGALGAFRNRVVLMDEGVVRIERGLAEGWPVVDKTVATRGMKENENPRE